MKTSVRFFSLLLAVLMLASVAISASASDAESYKKENEEALALLVKLGVFEGYGDGSLKPDSPVRRDEMAKIIFVLSTTFTDVGAGEVIFTDVPADQWAVNYISWCSNKGIIHGYGDGNFGPADSVTYDQALKMVCSALGYNDFDSKFWPVNVRTKALNELGLGHAIEKGGSEVVTRAEIAQIVYNALYTPMAQKSADGRTLTLADEYWKFEKKPDKILLIENMSGIEKGYVSLEDAGVKSLEELELTFYEDKAYLLFGTNVNLVYREGELLFAQVVTDYVDDAVITVDDKNDNDPTNDKFYINGEETDTISGFTAEGVPSEEDGFDYKLVAWDYDNNGKYDDIELSYYNAYTVTSIDEKTITLELYGTSDSNPDPLELEFATGATYLEKDDVVVATELLGHLFIKDVIAPVSASVNKYGNNKMTLEGVGEFTINTKAFKHVDLVTVPETIINLDEKGNKVFRDFYVYDGKVFDFEQLTIDPSAYNFALISYFNEITPPVYDPISQSIQHSYTAVIHVDGKQKTVPVSAENVLDDKDITEAVREYGKKYTNDGINTPDEDELGKVFGKYLLPSNVFVTYTVDEKGIYSFKTVDASNEEYEIINKGAKITYNDVSGLYTITRPDGSVFTNKADFANDAFYFYTYNKEETGHHVHVDVRGEASFTSDVISIETTSTMYVKKSENKGFWDIVAFVADEDTITMKENPYSHYKYDGRQILYCRYPTAINVDVETMKTYYSHKFQYVTGETVEFLDTERSIEENSTASRMGYFYVYDEAEKKYVELTSKSVKKEGVLSMNLYTIDDFLFDKLLFTNEDGMFKNGFVIDENVRLWTLVTSEGAIGNMTAEMITESLNTVRKYNEENGKDEKLRVIIFTYVDEKGETKVFSILSEYKYFDEEGEYKSYDSGPFNKFGSHVEHE